MENIFKAKEYFEIKTTLSKEEALYRIKNRTKICMIAGGRLIKSGKDNAAFIGKIIGHDILIYNRKPFKISHRGRMSGNYRVRTKAEVLSDKKYTCIKGVMKPSYLFSLSSYILVLFLIVAAFMTVGIITDENIGTIGRLVLLIGMFVVSFAIFLSNTSRIYKRLIKKTKKMLLTSFKNHMYEEE